MRRQQAAGYEALAQVERQRRRHQPLEPGPDTIYRLEMMSGSTGSGCQGGLEGSGGEHSGQPSGWMRREGGQAEQSSAAAEGQRGQREGEQASGSQRSGHTGSALQARDAGQVEGGKGKHSGHGTQGKGAGQEGLQGKVHGKTGLHGVGSKGHGAAGRKGKGQGKDGGHGQMGSPVFPGKGLGWWGGVVLPAIPPIVPPFPPPPYLAMGMMYPPLPAYQAMQPQVHVQQRPPAGGTAWGAQEGKGEEHRRAWEMIVEAERSLREMEARVMGGVGRASEGRTEGTGRPQGGEAQAVEVLQRAWADHRTRQERVERAERERGRHEEGGGQEGRPPLMPFRQPAIPLEQEGEMQERAWGRITGEAAKLAQRDREVATREEEEALAHGVHRVLPDPEGDGPSTDVEGQSPSGRRGQGGGRGGGAAEGEAAPGGGAGSRGSGGGAAACQPQPRADANGLGLRVATAAAVCAAAGAEGARDGRRLDGGGSGGAGPLREVGGEDEGKAGEEGDPPLQRPGRRAGRPGEKGA